MQNILDCVVKKWAIIADCPEKEINVREALVVIVKHTITTSLIYSVLTNRYFIDSWIFPRTGIFRRFSLSLVLPGGDHREIETATGD